jgi:hypothetical protein
MFNIFKLFNNKLSRVLYANLSLGKIFCMVPFLFTATVYNRHHLAIAVINKINIFYELKRSAAWQNT